MDVGIQSPLQGHNHGSVRMNEASPQPTLPNTQQTDNFSNALKWSFDKRATRVSIVVGAQVGSVRPVAFQVIDRVNRPVAGRWSMKIAVCAAPFTFAGPSSDTVTVVDGSLVASPVANRVIEVVTDQTGSVVIEVDGAAGARHIYAWDAEPLASNDATWA